MMPFDPALNQAAILTALRIPNTTAITPVHGGAGTARWRVEHGSTTYALRVFRREQVATYQCELVAMELARHAHLPVSTVHATAFWQERPALLLSWCPVSPLGHTLQRHPWHVWALGIAFGRMQARIHSVHVPPLGTQSHAEWIAWAGPDESRLQAILRRITGVATAPP